MTDVERISALEEQVKGLREMVHTLNNAVGGIRLLLSMPAEQREAAIVKAREAGAL